MITFRPKLLQLTFSNLDGTFGPMCWLHSYQSVFVVLELLMYKEYPAKRSKAAKKHDLHVILDFGTILTVWYVFCNLLHGMFSFVFPLKCIAPIAQFSPIFKRTYLAKYITIDSWHLAKWFKKSLKIPKGYSEAENRRTIDNKITYRQRTNNYLQNTTQEAKDWVTQTPLKAEDELMFSGRIISSCSTSGIHRVTFVTNPVARHEWGRTGFRLRQTDDIPSHLWHWYSVTANQMMKSLKIPKG